MTKFNLALFLWCWGAPFLTQCFLLDCVIWRRPIRWKYNLMLSAIIAVVLQAFRLAAA